MVLKAYRAALLAGLVLAGAALVCSPQTARAGGRDGRAGELFYNFYVPPGSAGAVGAQLYVAPRPTPPLVGHTYITYQPLMPHEFLYRHHRVYYRSNPGAGWTRTKVSWR